MTIGMFHMTMDLPGSGWARLPERMEQTEMMEKIAAEFPELKIAVGHFGMVTRENWMSQIRLAKNEIYGCREIAIFKNGVTL